MSETNVKTLCEDHDLFFFSLEKRNKIPQLSSFFNLGTFTITDLEGYPFGLALISTSTLSLLPAASSVLPTLYQLQEWLICISF